MKNEPMDYLKTEFHFLEIAYKSQFSHFMKVFYFWTVLITIPITAGLLTRQHQNAIITTQPIFLVLIGIVGSLLYMKMVDIRMSQLRYSSKMNNVRNEMFILVKKYLSKFFEPPFRCDYDLRKEAMKDFGVVMSVAMSLINAIYLSLGLPFFCKYLYSSSLWIFTISFIIGIVIYFIFIFWRGPKPNKCDK